MSTVTDWSWLYSFLLENNLSFLPGIEGEPWVSYKAASHFVHFEAETLEKKARSLPKHPAFKGYIRLSDFERAYKDKKETVSR